MGFLYAIIAGMMVPMQAGLNAQLKNVLGHAAFSVFVSLIVSVVALIAYIAWLRLAPAPASEWSRAPWWAWLGGVCGAYLLITTTNLAPKLGATALVACVIAGQVICSIVLDQFGWLGFVQHGINLGRAGGIVLLTLGVYMILHF